MGRSNRSNGNYYQNLFYKRGEANTLRQSLFWLSEERNGVNVDAVLGALQEENASYLKEFLEDLLEEHHDVLGWEACFKSVPVVHLDKGACVKIGDQRVNNPYLLQRLSKVSGLCVFYAASDPAMGERLKLITESFDNYLFSMVNNYCFNRAFEQVILQITKDLPKGAKLFMDNPGIHPEWDLSGQSLLFQLLFKDRAESYAEKLLRPDLFFKNPYSMAGIIYTTNQKDSTRPVIHYMDEEKLKTVLYQSAGVF